MGVYGGAATRLAREGSRVGEVERFVIGDGGGRIFAFAEDTGERGTGEPNDVAAGVHVEGDCLRGGGGA